MNVSEKGFSVSSPERFLRERTRERREGSVGPRVGGLLHPTSL